IEKKIKSAATDSSTEIKFDTENKAGISNLLTIYSVLSGKTIPELESAYVGKMYGHLKVDLAELVIETLKPVQSKYQELMQSPDHLDNLMKQGADKARQRAALTLDKVYKCIGLRK
ncbi:MAG: tryptophan--tRNA ligase, partial [Bdellovibrionales bacterium]